MFSIRDRAHLVEHDPQNSSSRTHPSQRSGPATRIRPIRRCVAIVAAASVTATLLVAGLGIGPAHAALLSYNVILNGASESPANASLGTGVGTIVIDTVNNTMALNVSFSGLTGNVTASHIHAPTAVPGSGTAGVATTTPTFAGFPVGVTSGTYSASNDMTLASSYNPAYITANGGTPASAFAALAAAIDTGRAYLNIHSTAFPGGEIRGFLTPAPTVTLVSPASGLTSGGTFVTFTGTAFTGATGATVGGVPLSGFSVVNATTITGFTGAHAAGLADVVVTVPGPFTATGTGRFTYVAPGTLRAYSVILNGPSESPANASPGTGVGTVVIDTVNNTMTLTTTFSGLTGNVTASHIHAATALPQTGTAGVATVTPSFTGFPTGVTGGTYTAGFNMALASSFNAAYITANGGTPASAFAALAAAIDGGRAYLNIHSTTFGGGEIRGFLLPAAAPTVTLSSTTLAPDASSLTITGTGFDGVFPGNNTVTFSSGATGTVTAATSTSLTVTFATKPAAGSLTAVVTNGAGSSGPPMQVAIVSPVVTTTTTTTIQLVFPPIPAATTPVTQPPTTQPPTMITTPTTATTTSTAPTTTVPTTTVATTAPPVTATTAVAPLEAGPATPLEGTPTFAG
jgi:hypothetical protein